MAVRNCCAGGGLWGGVGWLCQPDCRGKKPGRWVRTEEMGKRGRGFRKIWLAGEYERAGNGGGDQGHHTGGLGVWKGHVAGMQPPFHLPPCASRGACTLPRHNSVWPTLCSAWAQYAPWPEGSLRAFVPSQRPTLPGIHSVK